MLSRLVCSNFRKVDSSVSWLTYAPDDVDDKNYAPRYCRLDQN